jgi:hypothetical protein
MSADNWVICPECLKRLQQTRQLAINEASLLYGEVPAEQFIQNLAKAEALPERPEITLREDYELGMSDDGEFSVNYSCRCTDCDFRHIFKISEQVT